MDRLLIENDDNDGDEDGSPPPTIEEIETELEELDINMIAESDIDRSIQNAVRKLVDSGPKEIELSRVETFENIYKVRKMEKLKIFQIFLRTETTNNAIVYFFKTE